MSKKVILIFLIIGTAIIIGFLIFLIRKDDSSDLIKSCPDNWIEDRMPVAEGSSPNRQYFIVDGVRAETNNYDLDWIKNNCSVEIEYVY